MTGSGLGAGDGDGGVVLGGDEDLEHCADEEEGDEDSGEGFAGFAVVFGGFDFADAAAAGALGSEHDDKDVGDEVMGARRR